VPLDTLPGKIDVPTRDALVDEYLRDFRFHDTTGAATNDGTQPWTDANVFADMLLPVWAATRTAGSNLVLTEAQGAAIETWARIKGLEGRRPATGSTGYIVLDAAAAGSHIFEGDELYQKGTNLRFACAAEDTYGDDQPVPIRSIDTGSAVNLEPNAVLLWKSPRTGCGPQALVWENSQGDGLTGGGEPESDGEIVDRIILAGKNPPAAGNSADYILRAERTPGLAVQKAFVYEGIKGPGTVALAFTMRPDALGETREPSVAQIAIVETHVRGAFPKDDGLYVVLLAGTGVNVALKVDWRENAQGWADITPWPPYYEVGGTPGAVTVDAATDATHFVLESGDYTGIAQPKAGQRLAFYDAANAAFVLKTILTVTGTGPWTVACDTADAASDLAFTPDPGDRVMPWSTSLAALVPAVQAYFNTLGPGEQKSSFFDEGMRQRRTPRPPEWPYTIGNHLTTIVQDVPAVGDADLVEPAIPYVTPVGVAAVLSRLLELNQISVFPLTT
jgi:uncharacterized phage protein gp47/JayE